MMRLKKIIKRFVFEEENRALVAIGTGARLNPVTNRLQLQEREDGSYSTSAQGATGATWVTNPLSVRQWLNFEAFVEHAYDDLRQPLTSVGYRLGDGAHQYWWNGTAWVVHAVNWNTEADVANHIQSFPTTTRKLQVVANLATTDDAVTPQIQEIRVLYSSTIEFQEDLIVRSMIPMLRQHVRPISDYPITMSVNSATIDLAKDYPLETPYNVVAIDAVFNDTDDPGHLVDIYSAFNLASQVITLNQVVPAGKVVWVRFVYEPMVAMTTGQEYSEINRVPALILDDITLTNSKRVGQDTGILNKDAGSGTKVFGPRQMDVEITLRGVTDSARDQTRLADQLRDFFANNVKVVSKGMDEQYRLWLASEYVYKTVAGQGGVHSGFLRFYIVGALFFSGDVDVYAVKGMKMTGSMNVEIGG